MKIYNIKKTEGYSLGRLYHELSQGARIMSYGYCISIFALTFRLMSSPYYIKPGERLSKYRLKYNIYSLLFGWWGLPWGPIYTIDMVKINFKNGGGLDITDEILLKIHEKYDETSLDTVFAENITVEFDKSELTS